MPELSPFSPHALLSDASGDRVAALRLTDRLRAVQERLAAMWADGQAMSLEQASAFALEDAPSED